MDVFCVCLPGDIPENWPSQCKYVQGVCSSDRLSDKFLATAEGAVEGNSHKELLHVSIRYVSQEPLAIILDHPKQGVGKGLFAKRSIRPGTFICEYAGERVSWQLITEKYSSFEDTRYVWCEGEVEAIDAQFYGNEARFINHYESLAPHPNVRAQVVACAGSASPYRVLVKALRTIHANQEILLDYGPLYAGRWLPKKKKQKR